MSEFLPNSTGFPLEYFNYTSDQLKNLLQRKAMNRAINEDALIVLLILYVILIVTGATGNGLVCVAVARKPSMRTARNVFIINLAISDLILCLFTMPFSLVEIALKFWPLGKLKAEENKNFIITNIRLILNRIGGSNKYRSYIFHK